MEQIVFGCRVRVKDTAFGDSDAPQDIAARGQTGEVVWNYFDGRIEVLTDDDDFLLLTVDEIEVILPEEAILKTAIAKAKGE